MTNNAKRVKLYMGELETKVFTILESGKLGKENEVHIEIKGATDRILWAEAMPETNTDEDTITISNYIIKGAVEGNEDIVWTNVFVPEVAIEPAGEKEE